MSHVEVPAGLRGETDDNFSHFSVGKVDKLALLLATGLFGSRLKEKSQVCPLLLKYYSGFDLL